ncbi:Putative ZDHHC-type palmitoyltransferase 2 [Toxocara canis]|uniref:Palmitoyltransferase n=1 Tax=Toxocara canis TaxID=6265 RepID=A0A0B2UTA5_TOXCA|nr:Putative ZDHHC-type palmitoyltransferase 2 [Toxocara canis]
MECDRMAPKRSHHCQLCRMCVLRKDHHCFMTGGCVGIANQMFYTLNGYTMYDYHTLCRRYELKGDGETYGERRIQKLPSAISDKMCGSDKEIHGVARFFYRQ